LPFETFQRACRRSIHNLNTGRKKLCRTVKGCDKIREAIRISKRRRMAAEEMRALHIEADQDQARRPPEQRQVYTLKA